MFQEKEQEVMKLMMKVIAITGAAIMAPVGILKLTLQTQKDKSIVEAVLT